MAINWEIFQATATILAGDIASKDPAMSQADLAHELDKRFVNFYRYLDRMAKRIEAEVVDAPNPSGG